MSDKPFMDDAQRWGKIEEDVRRLKLPRGHLETKTVAVGAYDAASGDITVDTQIPDVHIAIDPFEDNPETKYLLGFRGVVREGDLYVLWSANGLTLSTLDPPGEGSETHQITTTPNQHPFWLPEPYELEDDSWIRCEIDGVLTAPARTLSAVILMLAIPH